MEEIEIEVKQNPATGKWNTWVKLPTGSLYRSECDEEAEAVKTAEAFIELAQEVFGDQIAGVKRRWNGYGGGFL